MSRTPQINIGLFGLGIVGSHVVELLEKNKTLITQKLGFPIHIKRICEPDTKKKHPLVSAQVLTTKPHDILDDPEISIIVELIGDRPAAREIMMKALGLGKNIVTANKAILATYGLELLSEAEKNEVEILFEAAVAGSIPILRSVREGFIADTIQGIYGIINGTANYILTGMAESGWELNEAVSKAQALGYAEANPTSDLEGVDTAHKLALLSTLAFGQWVSFDKIPRQGITQINKLDHEMAEKFGYVIKLLAVSKKLNDEIEARVSPMLVPKAHMLASVREAYNAVMLEGQYFGKSLLYGLGAGGAPTATAVLADIMELARNIALRVSGVPAFGVKMQEVSKAKLTAPESIESEYYFRCSVQDRPGVFGKIANILGQHQVGISQVYQPSQENEKSVPIVGITHRSKEKDVTAAIHEIDKLTTVTHPTQLLPVIS